MNASRPKGLATEGAAWVASAACGAPGVASAGQRVQPPDFPGRNNGVQTHFLDHVGGQKLSFGRELLELTAPDRAQSLALRSVIEHSRAVRLINCESLGRKRETG